MFEHLLNLTPCARVARGTLPRNRSCYFRAYLRFTTHDSGAIMDIGTKISEMKNSRSSIRLKLKQNSNDSRGFPVFTGACGAGTSGPWGATDAQIGGQNLAQPGTHHSSNAKWKSHNCLHPHLGAALTSVTPFSQLPRTAWIGRSRSKELAIALRFG